MAELTSIKNIWSTRQGVPFQCIESHDALHNVHLEPISVDLTHGDVYVLQRNIYVHLYVYTYIYGFERVLRGVNYCTVLV